ncbi:DUF2972 domain-containing protein [Helicobacter muridarum]|uniref:DUF2972 domain-containing protein n=1 Tax=Helicobacter muridarum TaxID=216 RepID=UPI0022793B7F|nr:DUF2972 domain-containing protein [Helicobacter muridarum]
MQNACKEYMREFLLALDERVKIESSHLVNEEQVLEYLKENMDLSIKLKEIFDYEFQDVCKLRPDIVSSWKYYKQFQDILTNNK